MPPLRKLTILVCVIVIAGVTASLVIRYRTQAALEARAELLRRQNHQLAELATHHRQLSNLIAQAARQQITEETSAELIKLRAEAESLRRQTNELAKRLAAEHRLASLQRSSKFDSTTHEGGSYHIVSDGDSDGYGVRLYQAAAGERNRFTGDARNLSSAVRAYARENQGRVPTSLDQAAPYAYKGELPLGGTYKERDTMAGVNDFEIVFQGSLDDLANIPRQAVALIRQRQPWPTPNGKSGRIYTMADGRLYVVESDDDFQAWEAEHIIPPPTSR
jgi:hypothetical protein